MRRARELLSLRMLHANIVRRAQALESPHASQERNFQTLDTLLPDGSILWSAEHQRMFTRERAVQEALAFADERRDDPPRIDPEGVEAIDALLSFLKGRGVEVFLAHPPFNPLFYERVKGTAYAAGLSKVEDATRELAAAHNLPVIGSFDPAELGCEANMFIDAEHGNAQCLGRLLAQYVAIDAPLTLRRTQD